MSGGTTPFISLDTYGCLSSNAEKLRVFTTSFIIFPLTIYNGARSGNWKTFFLEWLLLIQRYSLKNRLHFSQKFLLAVSSSTHITYEKHKQGHKEEKNFLKSFSVRFGISGPRTVSAHRTHPHLTVFIKRGYVATFAFISTSSLRADDNDRIIPLCRPLRMRTRGQTEQKNHKKERRK